MWIYFVIVLIDFASTSPTKSLLASRKYCGYQHTDDYPRTSGTIAIDEFPWMTQLLDDDDQVKCGGSLINAQYILTVAHCLQSPLVNIVAVRLGDYNINNETDCVKHLQSEEECSEPTKKIKIEDKIIHFAYNRRTAENDLGLIRLSKPVLFSDYIRPICLPREPTVEYEEGQTLFTSGWGFINFGGPPTEYKKRVIVTVFSHEKCRQMYVERNRKNVTNNHLCGIEIHSAVTCQGDTGAPLMQSIKNQWEQVGILSYGIRCDDKFPTVYLKVANYLDWIENSVRL